MEKKLLVEDHIRRNKRNTVIICTLMALLFLCVVFAIGYILFQGNIFISLAFGIPIGVALGAGIGSALQSKYGGKKVKLTKEKRKQIWMLTVAGVVLLILGVLAFAAMAYLG